MPTSAPWLAVVALVAEVVPEGLGVARLLQDYCDVPRGQIIEHLLRQTSVVLSRKTSGRSRLLRSSEFPALIANIEATFAMRCAVFDVFN